MGAFKYIQKSFEKSLKERTRGYRDRISSWMDENTVARAERPTNPLRARSLGYKAKKGYAIARVRIAKGKRSRRRPDVGRKPGRNVKRVNPGKELKFYAIEKASRRFSNMTPINAYLAGENGQYKFFEIILKETQ